ncbi:MAG: hypothetical protein SFW09_02305 [Hyphomicrobiaceae bacterium]|nr:hypothetical protein [Hyphomicrobiaceae bacterium]
MAEQLVLDLFVPDRFEGLHQRAPDQLGSIIEPVTEALELVDRLYSDMSSAGRGGFLILRGDSGSGKSTFLHTISLFRENVITSSLTGQTLIPDALKRLQLRSTGLHVVVVEEREALRDVLAADLERDLHAINGFLRSRNGTNHLVVWPTNTDDLEQQLIARATAIGADALLGTGEPSVRFRGPGIDQHKRIAENTVAVLNQGATLSDLGVSDDEFCTISRQATSVGMMLGKVRATINSKRQSVSGLLRKDPFKLWIIVAAGNEPDKDVAALTRGRYSAIDIERLMAATDANIVQELKRYPEKLGILGTVLDAKVFHLPMLAALDCARKYADADLRVRMQKEKLVDKPTATTKPTERLRNTDLGRILTAGSQGLQATGGRAGSNTEEAFRKLVNVAQSNDIALNKTVAAALKEAGFIKEFETEKDLGGGLTRKTDIVSLTDQGQVRMEMMWRARTSRAEIANYVLTKLYNYGRAIGFLSN